VPWIVLYVVTTDSCHKTVLTDCHDGREGEQREGEHAKAEQLGTLTRQA
jgi:hypothetical protein